MAGKRDTAMSGNGINQMSHNGEMQMPQTMTTTGATGPEMGNDATKMAGPAMTMETIRIDSGTSETLPWQFCIHPCSMEASTYRLPTESRGMSEAALTLCLTVDTIWVFFCMSIEDFYLADAHAYFGGICR